MHACEPATEWVQADVPGERCCSDTCRQEGFQPTADAVRKHLADLGQRDPMKDPEMEQQARSDLAAFRQGLNLWTVGEAKKNSSQFIGIGAKRKWKDPTATCRPFGLRLPTLRLCLACAAEGCAPDREWACLSGTAWKVGSLTDGMPRVALAARAHLPTAQPPIPSPLTYTAQQQQCQQ